MPSGVDGLDVIDNVIETDTLISIENVIGSNDGDIISATGTLDNVINGLAGDDTLLGRGGDDTLSGGEGNDLINGGGDNDILSGDAGNDDILGSTGDDTLLGGSGSDILRGGTGDDFIQGGGGSDITRGGSGIDTVSFADIGASVTVDLDAREAQYAAPNGNLIIDEVSGFENVVGSSNDDFITGDDGDNVLTGGLGNDTLNGGEGFDTADFSDIDVPVTVTLDENGNGTATRETGFSVSVDSTIVAPVQPLGGSQDFVTEAESGNLYFNIHTSDFLGGEIRGQLTLVEGSDTRDEFGVGSFTIDGSLDSSQEPGPLSDSEATGFGSVVVTVAADGTVSYTSELSVEGLAESDLQTPAPGALSAIHLHNAPAGINGPVVQDTLVDAGASINGDVPSGVDGLDVIDNVIETDTLISIENVVGSDDGVIINLADDAFTFESNSESLDVADLGIGELDNADFVVEELPVAETVVEAPVVLFAPTNSFDGDEFTS